MVFQHTWIKITGNLPGEFDADGRGGAGGAASDRIPDLRPYRRRLGTGGPGRPAHRNVAVDLAGGNPVAGITEMAVHELGAERVIYGSDAGGRSFASQLAKVHGADVPDEAKRLIFAGNLKRLLGPILEAKGVRI